MIGSEPMAAVPGSSSEDATKQTLEDAKIDPASDSSSDTADSGSEPAPKRSIRQQLQSLVVGILIALLVGEVAVRIMASQSLIYNIEMVRYAKELKMPDPRGEVSHVHRPNAT